MGLFLDGDRKDVSVELLPLLKVFLNGNAPNQRDDFPSRQTRTRGRRNSANRGKNSKRRHSGSLALRRSEQLKREFSAAQNYWSRKASEKGILTERDLQRYLGSCKYRPQHASRV